MRESAAKVCPVQIHLVLRLGDIHVLAAWAEDFHSRVPQLIADAHRDDTLAFAVDAGAGPKPPLLLLFLHLCQPFGREDLARVDEPLQVSCVLLHLDKLLITQIILVDGRGLGNHLHTLLLKFHFIPQSLQVEPVFNKL